MQSEHCFAESVRHWWRLVDLLGTTIAPRSEQEEHTAQHGHHVSDDGHPEAPAEVWRPDRVAGWIKRLSEVLGELGRVSLDLVRLL